MTTRYGIYRASLDSYFIHFDFEHEAMRYWREEIEHAPATDIRHGAVVACSTYESHQEAETARLNYVLTTGRIPYAPGDIADEATRLTEQRRVLDDLRGAPKFKTVQIWPKLSP